MYSIGADPEFFITDAEGAPTPIVGLVGGTKDKPLPLGSQGYAVQEDNVMAEFNIPPQHDPHDFAAVVHHGRMLALSQIRKKAKYAGTYPHCSAMFSKAQLSSEQAQMFGCSPDFDAHTQGRPLPRIEPSALYVQGGGAWRFAGGHVHIGYTLDWQVPDFVAAAMCDVYLSVPMIAYGYDPQGERRKWYGTPGRYRPTKYGIEYRTMGNAWTLSERMALFVGSGVMHWHNAMHRGEGHIRKLYNDLPWIDIRRAIAEEDQPLCAQLRDYFRNTLHMETI